MIRILTYTLLTLVCSTCLHGQEEHAQKDELLILKTIDGYFEGWMTGDTTLISQAMHSSCKLKNIKNEEVLVFDKATYLSFFKPRKEIKKATANVVSLDITESIASAKCRIETFDRLYTDYFNLMKLGERWYIVDKIAINGPK